MLGGRLADIYIHQTKTVVLLSIAVMVIGNIQYMLGIGLWNILCARLLCGMESNANHSTESVVKMILWRPAFQRFLSNYRRRDGSTVSNECRNLPRD